MHRIEFYHGKRHCSLGYNRTDGLLKLHVGDELLWSHPGGEAMFTQALRGLERFVEDRILVAQLEARL